MKKLILLLLVITLFSCKKKNDTTTPPPIKQPNPPALYTKGKYHGLYINVANNQDSLFVYTPYWLNGDTVIVNGAYKLFTKHFIEFMTPTHGCEDTTPYNSSSSFMSHYNCAKTISVFPPASSGVHITTTCNTISPVLLTITMDTVNLTIKTRFFTVPCLANSKDTSFIFKKQ